MSEFIPATDSLTTKAKNRKSLTPQRVGAFIGILFSTVIVVALAAHFAISAIAGGLSTKHDAPVALSEQTVLANLSAADINAPDLSGFAHITTDNLIGPRFENLSIGEIEEGDGAMPVRTVEAVAVFRNDYLSVSAPLVAKFSYDAGAVEWSGAVEELKSPSVKPLRAPSTATLEALVPELLSAHDASLAGQLEGASVLLRPSLTEEGGTVIAELAKPSADERSVTKCTANLSVSWDDRAGWKVAITSVDKPQVIDTAPKPENPSSLTCAEGDTVEVSGIIEVVDGHTVLRCDGPIDVTIGGNTTRVERFDLVTADPSLSVEVGAHVTVRGALSGNAGFSNAPFKISVVSV